MPSGNSPYVRRPIEIIAGETLKDLTAEALGLAKGRTPQNYELAARRFDQAADACREAERQLATEKALALRQEQADLAGLPLPTPWRPSCPAIPNPGPHQLRHIVVLEAGTPISGIGKILLESMVRSSKEGVRP